MLSPVIARRGSSWVADVEPEEAVLVRLLLNSFPAFPSAASLDLPVLCTASLCPSSSESSNLLVPGNKGDAGRVGSGLARELGPLERYAVLILVLRVRTCPPGMGSADTSEVLLARFKEDRDKGRGT